MISRATITLAAVLALPASALAAGPDIPQLEELIVEAQQAHPALQEAWSRYRAALQRAPQAASLPDPMLTFTQAIRSVETRVGPQRNLLSVTQRFPWFGKLDLAAQGALLDAESMYQSFRALQLKIAADVKDAYYELAYVDRALEVNRQEQAVLDHFERLAQSRYSAGQGLQSSVIKVQAELARLDNRVLLLEQQRGVLIARLNNLRGRPGESAGVPSAPLPEPPTLDLDLEALSRLAEQHRPELEAGLTHIDRGQQRIQLARRDYWPDFTLGAGFVDVGDREDPMGRLLPPPDNGKNVFTVSVGINLPIWRNRYDAAVLEATESLLAARQNYRRMHNDIQLAVREEMVRLQTLTEQRRLFREVLVPQNEEALRSSEAAYRSGQAGVLDLLDSERTLLELRLMQARLDTDQWKALARLELAVGTSLR